MSTNVNPIPPGFHSLTVHINVEGADKYINFLKRAFGAVEISRSPGPGGKLMHALVRVGDSMLMLNDDFSTEFRMPPVVRGNLPFHLNLYVPDADATFAQAVAAGCTVTMPIADQFWGPRSVWLQMGHRKPQGGSDAGPDSGTCSQGVRGRASVITMSPTEGQ